MKKSKLVFLIIVVVFILTMIGIVVHMNSQTTAPWEKKKELLDKYKVK
ncbi:MAG: hypothetical protein K2X86_17050 [Cytophagaceae bacterium]|nr:hypothetical protein [Cytophagaceae bacterium]